ncbi:MAG: hypothetical protein V3V75_05715, partial [Thermoguttaceae bacterium]
LTTEDFPNEAGALSAALAVGVVAGTPAAAWGTGEEAAWDESCFARISASAFTADLSDCGVNC